MSWEGEVVSIQITPQGSEPLKHVEKVEAVAGKGLKGDRYFLRTGTYSKSPAWGWALTLIMEEKLEEIERETGLKITATDSRRNILTRGVALDDLVGKRFRVGEVLLEGTCPCEPCTHVESLTQPGAMKALIHRGGLCANVHEGGVIRVGDPIRPAP